MRELVGLTDPAGFDHPVGSPVFPTVAASQYESVLDFGCGCGRVARQLGVAAAPMPGRYVGIDLHRGMIRWDRENLAPRLPGFSFQHHDVFNPGLNPDPGAPRTRPVPVADAEVTLLIAISVFTHLVEAQAEYYLGEVARVLRQDGVMVSSWFLFDKAPFPMMQEFQNALYINDSDPTNAVIFDRSWLLAKLDGLGLRVRAATPPTIRGFHWILEIEPGRGSVALAQDTAPEGHAAPPIGRANPAEIGL
jgi:SAM-dependent methyltransferase